MNVLDELIKSAGGCAVIDGGLATQLENHGVNINHPLWSALCLITHPHIIKQATLPGFTSNGLSIEEGESLLRKSVKLACEARDSFWETLHNASVRNGKYCRALVAASVGSYGAYLADGSEYSGDYGSDITLDKLKDFHRRRLKVLVEAGPDLLAFETIPNKLEAQACIELLEEENIQVPAWLCFSSTDSIYISSGETIQECINVVKRSEKVVAVGVNCSPPEFIEDAIEIIRKETDKAVVVYPNSGEKWDGKAKQWLHSNCFSDGQFGVLVKRWREAGAKLIGGCCRTTPATIEAICKVLKEQQ
ncbi:homocysteine S-methyltransferase 1 isoform X2 [Cryptomeria japonica]|uniref:homocysteine S-methyltransferase 1 isoform X2 n=1 Tax=Cryptomeria japonica TaxID=3369 RepID=UPI0025ACAE13|nr:homocysteine S-methyltransferase 1 isoform X2 [Cryptomeria japonica]